ncbi:hypothetical protein KKF55_05635 [Patescibacteria group bacterium]|nr:hypothetical protein [Patescibacteria group bacterium]
MPTPSYTIICKQNSLITHNVHEVRFEKPEGFLFESGQFALLDVPLLDNPDDIQTRAYSIASTPDEDDLLFVIKIKPDGRAGQWVKEKLKEGDDVRIQGPLGNFTFECDSDRDCLFVCTGVGAAPFRSQILSALKAGNKCEMDLIIGVFAEEDIFWADLHDEITSAHPNMHVHITLSDPKPTWKGFKGRVQEVIPTIANFKERNIYLCGNPAMTTNVKKMCLEEWGIAKEQVHMEGYI